MTTTVMRPSELPVAAMKAGILELLRKHQILICVGETGSGKTTQIPQYLLDGGFAEGDRRVAVTQPRRVATVSVAKRVTEERNLVRAEASGGIANGASAPDHVGGEVGYVIRFEDCTSERTRLRCVVHSIA